MVGTWTAPKDLFPKEEELLFDGLVDTASMEPKPIKEEPKEV